MSEPANPYLPPRSEPSPENCDMRRPASSKWMIVISTLLAGVIGWVYYEIIKEAGFSKALDDFDEYPIFIVISACLLAAPVLMLRRKPGWTGYLLGCLSSFTLAGYFVSRVISQSLGWVAGRFPLGYLLIGVAFALPFVILFVRFAFGRPSRRFHGIGLQRTRQESISKLTEE